MVANEHVGGSAQQKKMASAISQSRRGNACSARVRIASPKDALGPDSAAPAGVACLA